MKHTSGPWKILRGKRVDSSLYLKVLQSEKRPHLHIKAYSIDRETAEANAHLIAAAPDLLGACKKYVELYDASWDGITQDFAIIEIKKAIAKAEGRE